MPSRRISIGAEPLHSVDDADAFVNGAMIREGADFAILPIMRSSEAAAAEQVLGRGYFAPGELVIKSSESSYCLLGATSPWDSALEHSEALVSKEAEYAGYTGLKGIVAPVVAGDSAVAAYGRQLYSLLTNETGPDVYVRVRMGGERAWEQWNRIRVMCNHSPRLQVLLELDPRAEGANAMQQWLAEPVRAAVLVPGMFVQNAGGFPVLPRQHQMAVKAWMDYGVAFAVQAPDAGPGLGDRVRYLRHLAESLP
ncbi:hypothetical protein GGF43_004136, partial [Coemansia sp. RSA 2618]